MALQTEPKVTWDKSTPNDGNLLNEEFSTIYENFDKIENKDFTFNGDISVKNSLTVNNRNITGSALELIPESAYEKKEELDGDIKIYKYRYVDTGLFKIILKKKSERIFNLTFYKTIDCNMYSKRPTPEEIENQRDSNIQYFSHRYVEQIALPDNESFECVSFYWDHEDNYFMIKGDKWEIYRIFKYINVDI